MMDTRTLVDRVQMRTIFWNTEIELVMKLKPTVVLDEKDVVSMKEITSGTVDSVGIQPADAKEAWKAWIDRYKAALELWGEEQKTGVKDMLWEIHGLPRSSQGLTNEERGALQGDQGSPGSESPS